MEVVKFARRGNSYSLAVPRRMMASLRWTPGDLIALKLEGGSLKATSLTPHLVRMERRKAHGKTSPAAGGAGAETGGDPAQLDPGAEAARS